MVVENEDEVEIVEPLKQRCRKINTTIKYDKDNTCERYKYLRLKYIAR